MVSGEISCVNDSENSRANDGNIQVQEVKIWRF